ncbi:MAG: hypothetical protein ACK5BN_01560, partial [Planctomycetota bacterium]
MTAIAAASSLYAPRAAALALAHAATGPALVLSAGILPADFAAATRLVIVLLPTSAGGLLVGWANAALLRAMPRAASPWLAVWLAAASPFASGVGGGVRLRGGGVVAGGGLP